jgi:DNA-binding MarR family transcriptional regulator
VPNRILRDGILTSPKIAKLGWPEEVLYRRLMSLVDDYGRYFADASVLRGHAYPRQLSKVSDSDVAKWIRAIEEAGLVRVYPAEDGERYLEIVNFGQQIRATKSKFPQPMANEIICNQLLANAHLDVSVSVSEFVSDKQAVPAMDNFEAFWKAYPKKKAKDDALKAFNKRKVDKQLLDSMLAAIAIQARSDDWTKDAGKFIPYPATWLNDGRWQDGETVEIASVVVDAAAVTREALQKRDEGTKTMPAHIRAQLDQLTKRMTL